MAQGNLRPLVGPQDAGATALELVDQAADVFQAQRDLIIATDQRLQEASRALEQAYARIDAQQDQLTAFEFRAQAAEANARKVRQALALVEESIRRQLLCAKTDVNVKSA